MHQISVDVAFIFVLRGIIWPLQSMHVSVVFLVALISFPVRPHTSVLASVSHTQALSDEYEARKRPFAGKSTAEVLDGAAADLRVDTYAHEQIKIYQEAQQQRLANAPPGPTLQRGRSAQMLQIQQKWFAIGTS